MVCKLMWSSSYWNSLHVLCSREGRESAMDKRARLRYYLLLLFVPLATESSSDILSNVTLSKQNERVSTSSTSSSTNTTTAATSDNSTSFDDNNATAAMLTASEPSLSSFWQYYAYLRWYSIGSPILIVVATVGNTLSLITLQNPMFRKSSTSFIMSALAFSDLSVVNITLLRLWIAVRYSIDIRRKTSFGCKFHPLLTYYSRDVRGKLIKLLLHARYSKPTDYAASATS